MTSVERRCVYVAVTAVATALMLAGLAVAAEPATVSLPIVTAFVMPSESKDMAVPVTSLTASGEVAGYLITRTAVPPTATQPGWSASPPKTLTAPEPGVYDYYAWAKDSQDRVSRFASATVDVATTKITVGPKDRNFTNFVDAIAAVAAKGNPKGVVIEADAGEYPSRRPENEYKGKEPYLKNIIKIVADNLTIRGVGGRAHLAYKCRGATSKDRWTIPPAGLQHGAVIVQAARNFRLESVEISGGCNATSMNGAGLWVEPAGVGTVLKNCYVHHNDNGILTSRIPGARVRIMNSEFFQNGAPGPADEGQNHNIYVGEVDELVFMFNFSHSSYRGQLLKSRAGRNYVLYNRLTDEADSNYAIDLPYGGESYLVGNVVQLSKTNRAATFISYGREVVMKIVYSNGGPEPLKDRAELTNTRTGKKHPVRYSINYGATGKWEDRDRANFCTLSIREADGPDFVPGDKLTYGKDGSIQVVRAEWSWASDKRVICVCNNTFVNECASGYGQYLLRAHADTAFAGVCNNVIVDIKPPKNPYKLHPDAAGPKTKEKAVLQADNLWATEDPGFVDLAGFDYRPKAGAKFLDAAKSPPLTGPAAVGDTALLVPVYEYVHPASRQDRPDDGKLDLGAYEYVSSK